jgi:hypothetical protein
MAEQIDYSKGRGKRYMFEDIFGTGVSDTGFVTVANSNMKQFCLDKGLNYKDWQKSLKGYNAGNKILPGVYGWKVEAIV